MNVQQTVQRPIVIFVNDVHHRDLSDEAVLNFIEYIVGARPQFIEVTVPHWWLTRPEFVAEEFDECYATEVKKENPEINANTVKGYMEAYEFGIYVMDGLLNALEGTDPFKSHGFSQDAVRLVVLEAGFEFSAAITEACKDYLPNAVICDEDSERVSHPLICPVEALKLDTRTTRALVKCKHFAKVGWLVESNEAELMAIPGIGKKALVQIKAALAKYGLELRQK